MDLKRRLYFLIISIILVVMIGSSGYYLLFHGSHAFIDCLFMTVISLTSVGYGEIVPVTGNVPAQIFTMLLITVGMGIILYGIGALTALFIEGEVSGLLRGSKMKKTIQKLNDHYIVCGGGETGFPVLMELDKNGETSVLIEQDEGKIDICRSIPNLLYIKGDATEDENLVAAGIGKARGLLIVLSSDKDALYVTMTARMLNPQLRIITRVGNPMLEPKFVKAGADGVVSPNFIGALRMASVMIRPVAVDFLDRMLRSEERSLRIHEIPITEKSGVSGKTIAQSGLKDNFGLLVLGLEDQAGHLQFNPSPSTVLEPGMVLVVMGEVANIKSARHSL
jgi:voltage-gated potassium channel